MTINILIVDDKEENIYALESLLCQMSITTKQDIANIVIHKALSGEEALEIAMDINLDLVLLDVQMPGMDGFEVAKFLKLKSSTKSIPIIFITAAFKSDEFISQGYEIGAVDYFTKPIERFAFLNRMRLYISLFIENKKFLEQKKLADEQIMIAQEQKRVAEQLMQTKSTFLANMSHEIRTPLNAITGFIEIIKEETKEDNTKKYATIIDDSSQSLLQIIEDVLDFSKIESGKLNIEKIGFDLKKEFDTVSYLFSVKCSEKDISLSIKYEDSLPSYIKSDPLRIKQIISNLLSNAIKFTPSGKKIDVIFSMHNKFLKVAVKDEGKGIAKEKLEHIFEAFAQEDISTTREHGGTGLGLAITKELANLLGGTIHVKSELGVGSDFYFEIPVETVKQLESGINESDVDVDFENKKVLVAEDNKANQVFMEVILESMGLKCEIVNDGLEAIEALKNAKFDAILMDENMPNLNGIGATKEILKYEKENNIEHTPIIALTANALKGDRERFLAAGMDEYMTKPFNKKSLTKMLNGFI